MPFAEDDSTLGSYGSSTGGLTERMGSLEYYAPSCLLLDMVKRAAPTHHAPVLPHPDLTLAPTDATALGRSSEAMSSTRAFSL